MQTHKSYMPRKSKEKMTEQIQKTNKTKQKQKKTSKQNNQRKKNPEHAMTETGRPIQFILSTIITK